VGPVSPWPASRASRREFDGFRRLMQPPHMKRSHPRPRARLHGFTRRAYDLDGGRGTSNLEIASFPCSFFCYDEDGCAIIVLLCLVPGTSDHIPLSQNQHHTPWSEDGKRLPPPSVSFTFSFVISMEAAATAGLHHRGKGMPTPDVDSRCYLGDFVAMDGLRRWDGQSEDKWGQGYRVISPR